MPHAPDAPHIGPYLPGPGGCGCRLGCGAEHPDRSLNAVCEANASHVALGAPHMGRTAIGERWVTWTDDEPELEVA